MTDTVDQSGVLAALKQRADGSNGPTLLDVIRQQEPEIAKALGQVMDPVRFTRLVLTEIKRTPALASCTPGSILGGMMHAASLRVEFGPLQRAYLIPRWNSKAGVREAQFMLGYRGMLELARRSETIKELVAREVCDQDEFDFDLGDTPHLHHKWDVRKERGKIVAYYGVCTTTNGGKIILPVSLNEIAERRARAATGNATGPWDTDPVPMSRKTVIRMMEPWLPLTSEVSEAFQTDEAVRIFDPDAGATRVEYPELPPGDDPGEPERVACADCGGPIDPDGDDDEVAHNGEPHHRSCVPRDVDAAPPAEEGGS